MEHTINIHGYKMQVYYFSNSQLVLDFHMMNQIFTLQSIAVIPLNLTVLEYVMVEL